MVAVKVEEQGGVQVQVPLGGDGGGVVEGSNGDLSVDAAVVPADDEVRASVCKKRVPVCARVTYF